MKINWYGLSTFVPVYIENINLTKNVASTDICKIYLKNIPNETGINTTIITTTVYKYNWRNKTPPQNCSLNQWLFTYPGTDWKSCKIKDNGQCYEEKVRWCMDNSNRVISTWTYMTDGKITWVHWRCEWRDSTSDVCKINCWAWETLSRDDTTHNYECKSENINWECKYWWSEPQCKWSIEPSNVVWLDCWFTRKCKWKWTWKTDNCRMEYVAQKTTYNRQEIYNTSVFTNNEVCVAGNGAATNPVSNDIIQSLSNFNRWTQNNCMNATSWYRRRPNNGEDWKKGDICKIGSPNCIPCFACQFGWDYDVTSSTTPWKCTIWDTDYAENHSQCGLLKQNCTISNPTCISYNIEKNGIDVCKNDSITKQTGLSKDECIEVQENKPRRRTASFGPTYWWTTYEIFNTWDLCSPWSVFCAPCAVCVCEWQGQEESICTVTVSNTHGGGTIYEPGYLSDFALVINGYMYSTTDRPCTPSPGNSQICKFSVPELLEYKGKPVYIQATLTQWQSRQVVQANLWNVSQYGWCNFSVSL